jgi:predicted enzyme related to lactoylglutathione lyase
MTSRLVHLVIDAADPLSQAQFWGEALHWSLIIDGSDEVVASPPGFTYPGTTALPLVFVPVSEPKITKNRVHLDLASASLEDQAAQVRTLLELGATQLDIGQGDVPWVVLADPEGNEFCVLEPRPGYGDTGPVAAVVVDSADRQEMARFWSTAAGWPISHAEENLIALRSGAAQGPYLEMLASSDPKTVKNRVHLDVAPLADEDLAAESARLQAAGARLIDVGQADVDWIVLADPEGQEFCILTPR